MKFQNKIDLHNDKLMLLCDLNWPIGSSSFLLSMFHVTYVWNIYLQSISY